MKMTQEELAGKVGVSRVSVSQWESGYTAPKGKNLYLLCQVLKCQPDWLLFDKDDTAPEANARRIGEVAPWDIETLLADDEVELPFFAEVELSAGGGSYAVQEDHGPKLRFARAMLKKAGVTPTNAACTRISGNSMEPLLPDGATIGVDTACTSVKDGEIYAIEHDGMLRVKLVYRRPGGGLRLRSFNKEEYPDEVYDSAGAKGIRLIGRVFWYSVLR